MTTAIQQAGKGPSLLRLIGMVPKRTEPRVMRDPWRKRATRKVLQHVERARLNLQDFQETG